MNYRHVSRTAAAVVLASRPDEKPDDAVGRQHAALADPDDWKVAEALVSRRAVSAQKRSSGTDRFEACPESQLGRLPVSAARIRSGNASRASVSAASIGTACGELLTFSAATHSSGS